MPTTIDSTKGQDVTVLSQRAQHKSSAFTKSSERAEGAFTIKDPTANNGSAVIKCIEYLDLATDIKLGNAKSDGKVFSNSAFIEVPFGKQKLINRALLKLMVPTQAFHLFPNLPLEIRQKIFGYTVEGVTVQIKLTDNGQHWVGEPFPPPELIAASKEAAVRYIDKNKQYVPIFKNGTTLYNPELDDIFIKLVASVNQPVLTIGTKFVTDTIMAGVSSMTFEIRSLDYGAVEWINNNLRGMSNLKNLAIHGFFPISATGQNEVTLYVISKDVEGIREEYTHVLQSKSGAKFRGFNAMAEINNNIVTPKERQGVIDLWMMLDRCLKNRTNFPNFPSTVLTALHWVNSN